ncbi:putative arsenite resistance protein Ars2 [Aspergillus brunneoviolaceus CBS 621.78]|uniref:Arsenite resistance protein Ars2 n=1 Tax=Aspergillus brunneoviolaceus CBS 621.78 TaxID=1450534 RepID=A0ACD1GJY7_9EURO|nr:putative arsenite resistance protein Ars2 [Aspergillus brunneoviolaceus CBS 621.78]RAH49649.1 putative arsenite resistance protein Ars2 [Aspergillus brunneoviolaceus CBS 621.78]
MDAYDTFGSPGRSRDGGDPYATRAPVDSYRRRSPVSQDRRRGRGRSRSPAMIDRYEPVDRRAPRDDYYGASREHAARERDDRRSAPSPNVANIDRYVPGQDSGKRPIPTNPLPNPLNLDFQVGFNWFAEWWRAEQAIKEEKERAKHGGRRPSDRVKGEREAREDRDRERAQIQAAYDAYKVDLQAKMARTFVQHHRNEEWFKERYVPEVREPLRRRLMDFRMSAYEQWENDLETGIFDEFTLEGIYKSESDGAGGVIEKEEGETTAVGETLGVLDLLPARGGDLRDEALSQSALLIKTLAPNVSRAKIEEFCKEHLGESDGGFKWLSLSDPNPSKKYHRMGWIMLHPAPDVPIVERGDGREEEGEEMDQDSNSNGNVTVSAAEKALEAINDKTIHDEVHGDFVCHVGVHVPPSQPRKKALWDLFSSPERISRDLELARRLVSRLDAEMGAHADGFTRIEERVEDLRGKGWLQPPVTGPVSVKKRKSDYDADDIDEGEAEEGEEREGWEDDDVDDEELLAKKKKLDLMVEYLRRVYNFCFFCVFECDSVHELARKCPGGHLRRPRAGLTTQSKAVARASALGQPFPVKKKEPSEEGEEQPPAVEERRSQRYSSKSEQQLQRAFNWVRTFEDKLLQILEPENVDIAKLGGKPVDEALEEELSKFMKQEDESKYRCKVPECTKLFKADHFWRKHVEKRHTEWYENIRSDLALVNAYVLDPARIAPSRSDANSNGHFPLGTGQGQAGTPRGFSLASMPAHFAGSSGVPPGFQGLPGSGLPGFMGVNNSSWSGNGIVPGDGHGLHQPGVVRRGGGRYNNRTGPYDRRGNRHGAQAGGIGRLSPIRGMSSIYGAGGRLPASSGAPYIPAGHPAAAAMLGGGNFPDASGAQQGMGPREAVQGRSLKSYEDLDAVGGAGSGELNY